MADSLITLLPVFVYGTLKRGECRAKCWPRVPLRVETAYTRGRLYDLGPYPAMTPGDDVIHGELWHLQPEDLAITLEVLDQIEGCVDGSDDEYVRVTIDCQLEGGETCAAYAYHYARFERLSTATVIRPGTDGFCVWPLPVG